MRGRGACTRLAFARARQSGRGVWPLSRSPESSALCARRLRVDDDPEVLAGELRVMKAEASDMRLAKTL